MSHDELDPRLQKLVAALYGELDDAEEREVRDLLDADPALRAEFEELDAARTFLRGWEEEPAPDHVFLAPPEWAAGASGGGRRGGEEPGGLRGWLARLLPPPAWGFAGATAVLAVLILAGFRVDRLENGVAFRFGPAAAPGPARMAAAPVLAPGTPLTSPDPGSLRAVPASAGGYVTVDQLDAVNARTLQAVSAMLGSYEQRRNSDLAYALQGFYNEMMSRQMATYDDLRTQIQGVGLGLLAEQSKANARLESLVGPDGTPKALPVSQTPVPGKRGGNDHD